MYLCQRKVIVQVRSWQQQIAYLLSHDYVTERYYLLTHCTTAYFDVLSRPCIAQFILPCVRQMKATVISYKNNQLAESLAQDDFYSNWLTCVISLVNFIN